MARSVQECRVQRAVELRQKIAQQSELLASYVDTMQSLRSSTKATHVMELEEERE
jgi:hypothetical protein